jgi:hypothetical protein
MQKVANVFYPSAVLSLRDLIFGPAKHTNQDDVYYLYTACTHGRSRHSAIACLRVWSERKESQIMVLSCVMEMSVR